MAAIKSASERIEELEQRANHLDLQIGALVARIIGMENRLKDMASVPGPAGPMGPAGPVGATGAVGPMGPAGR